MTMLFKTTKLAKRYLVWIPNAAHQNYKEYNELVDIMKDLGPQIKFCNILDTLNSEWLILEDV